MALDVSPMKSVGEPLPHTALRDRARELGAYVDELQAGYRRLAGTRNGIALRRQRRSESRRTA